jgi:tetratricopeptide (TPR) repeat protein
VRPTVLLGLACSLVAPLSAQHAAPRRPKLDLGTDTNAAGAYYAYGLRTIQQNPERAADAFYWATRLDPAFADAWYGRWAASLLAQPAPVLGGYLSRFPRILRAPEIQRIDSLRREAFLREPLVSLRFESTLIAEWLQRETGGEVSLLSLESATTDPWVRGWLAYARGRYADATGFFALALARHPDRIWIHEDRARAFIPLLQYDSAVTELQQMLDSARGRESERLVFVYESKAMTEYMIGRIAEVRGDAAGAHSHYAAALLEDLAFYRGHMALGRLALGRGDTTESVAEFGLAAELAPADPNARYEYGLALFAARRFLEATEQFGHAVAADSDFAAPYYPLAYVFDNTGRDSLAISCYREFLRRAPRDATRQIADARSRLADLTGH